MKVVILGIDSVERKTLYQIDAMSQYGVEYDIFTNDKRGVSYANIGDRKSRVYIVPRMFHQRVYTLLRYLHENRRRIRHAELYSAGRFAFIYVLLCKLLHIHLLVIERGDILPYMERRYGISTRFSMWMAYKFADCVLWKELYAKDLLEAIGVKSMVHLANAVPIPDEKEISSQRHIEFLWVNRLLRSRHPDWIAEIWRDSLISQSHTLTIAGLIGELGDVQLEAYVISLLSNVPSVQILPFTDPRELYRNACFFLLPADTVYLNYSLLEAMSYGVVPIVSRVSGADEVVRHGDNGILVDHSRDGFRRGMQMAAEIRHEEWLTMSARARDTVKTQFSLSKWADSLYDIYQSMKHL